MFKVLFVLILIAFYFFSTITYTSSNQEIYAKVNNSWKFNQVNTEQKVKDHYWFNYFISGGFVPQNGDVTKSSIIEFSYLKKK